MAALPEVVNVDVAAGAAGAPEGADGLAMGVAEGVQQQRQQQEQHKPVRPILQPAAGAVNAPGGGIAAAGRAGDGSGAGGGRAHFDYNVSCYS